MSLKSNRQRMWARKAIGATLAGCAMAMFAPACSAVADPIYGPDDVSNPAFDEYMSTIKHLADQANNGGRPSGLSQQEIHDQLTAANDQLREALLAGR